MWESQAVVCALRGPTHSRISWIVRLPTRGDGEGFDEAACHAVLSRRSPKDEAGSPWAKAGCRLF